MKGFLRSLCGASLAEDTVFDSEFQGCGCVVASDDSEEWVNY
jgi:hypothetical protein